jgi:thiol-disulfide isomerase/thioredoxin
MFLILIAVGFSDVLAGSPFDNLFERTPCRFCWMFEAAPVVVIEKPKPERSYRVLYFTAPWCGPCRAVTSRFDWLKRGGWTIGSEGSNHIQTIDVDVRADEWSRWRGSGANVIPTAILIRDGKEVARMVPGGAGDLVTLFNGNR